MVFRLRGCSANWMPLSVRIVRIRYGSSSRRCSRNSHAARLSALSTSRVTANLLVRSIATKRKKACPQPSGRGNVRVKEADGITLEALQPGFVTIDVGQARYVVTLKATVQCRSRQLSPMRVRPRLRNAGDDIGISRFWVRPETGEHCTVPLPYRPSAKPFTMFPLPIVASSWCKKYRLMALIRCPTRA